MCRPSSVTFNIPHPATWPYVVMNNCSSSVVAALKNRFTGFSLVILWNRPRDVYLYGVQGPKTGRVFLCPLERENIFRLSPFVWILFNFFTWPVNCDSPLPDIYIYIYMCYITVLCRSCILLYLIFVLYYIKLN